MENRIGKGIVYIIKNWAQTSVTHTSIAVNTYIREFVYTFADAICVDLNDPLITYSGGGTFDAYFSPSYHCDMAPAPAVGIGLLIAIVIGALLTGYCLASKRKLSRHFDLELVLLLTILSGLLLLGGRGGSRDFYCQYICCRLFISFWYLMICLVFST